MSVQDPLPDVPLSDIIQSLRAKAAFEHLYPGDANGLIEFVSRLEGRLPDAYDIPAAGAYFESCRILKEKVSAVLEGRVPKDLKVDWDTVSDHALIRVVENLTVSMGRGKGRKEGVEIAATTPPPGDGRRWRWGRPRE